MKDSLRAVFLFKNLHILFIVQQRAKLAIAFRIFVQATDAVDDHAEVIVETYNRIADLYKGIAKMTQNIIDKLNKDQKIRC